MARALKTINWAESTEELYDRYRAERELNQRKRLQVLWLVRQGREGAPAPQPPKPAWACGRCCAGWTGSGPEGWSRCSGGFQVTGPGA